MKFKIFILFVFFVCCLLPGFGLAQDKVVVIPLWSDSGDKIPTVSSNGQVWMDRDLGAYEVAESEDDHRAYGWLYQWGRLADGHEIRFSPSTATLSSGNVPGHGNFITSRSSPRDWRSPQNDTLWQGESGVNNPCPAGFRVPTETEWDTERASWSSDNSAGAFASPLKLVVAGRHNIADGSILDAGIAGFYWSSTVNGINTYDLSFTSGAASLSSTHRAYGFSVRCIKD